MAFKVLGMEEIIETLTKLENAGSKQASTALKEAGEEVKNIEQEVARTTHNKYSEQVGWKEIKTYPIKTSKRGVKYINIGLKAKQTKSQKKKDLKALEAGDPRPTYWDKIKGLYYNNYGFYHYKEGKYVAGSHWIDDAYDKSAPVAYEKLKDKLIEGIDEAWEG